MVHHRASETAFGYSGRLHPVEMHGTPFSIIFTNIIMAIIIDITENDNPIYNILISLTTKPVLK